MSHSTKHYTCRMQPTIEAATALLVCVAVLCMCVWGCNVLVAYVCREAPWQLISPSLIEVSAASAFQSQRTPRLYVEEGWGKIYLSHYVVVTYAFAYFTCMYFSLCMQPIHCWRNQITQHNFYLLPNTTVFSVLQWTTSTIYFEEYHRRVLHHSVTMWCWETLVFFIDDWR